MSTQADILAAFKEGRFIGSKELPVHIETLTSHVFLSGEAAYKVYKEDSTVFNENFSDLSDPAIRSDFIRTDFEWNHAANPATYIALKGAVIVDGQVIFVETGESAHWVIVMNRFDSRNELLRHLSAGTLTSADFGNMGSELARSLTKVVRLRPDIDLYKSFVTHLVDLRAWIGELSGEIPVEEGAVYVDYLETFIETHRSDITSSADASMVVDGHMGNMLLTDGTLSMIDIFPPKEDWRYSHRDVNVYRLATDIYALSGEEAFRAFLQGFEIASNRKLNKELEPFFVTYAASIMVPYLYVLGAKSELHMRAADQYHRFLREYFARVA